MRVFPRGIERVVQYRAGDVLVGGRYLGYEPKGAIARIGDAKRGLVVGQSAAAANRMVDWFFEHAAAFYRRDRVNLWLTWTVGGDGCTWTEFKRIWKNYMQALRRCKIDGVPVMEQIYGFGNFEPQKRGAPHGHANLNTPTVDNFVVKFVIFLQHVWNRLVAHTGSLAADRRRCGFNWAPVDTIGGVLNYVTVDLAKSAGKRHIDVGEGDRTGNLSMYINKHLVKPFCRPGQERYLSGRERQNIMGRVEYVSRITGIDRAARPAEEFGSWGEFLVDCGIVDREDGLVIPRSRWIGAAMEYIERGSMGDASRVLLRTLKQRGADIERFGEDFAGKTAGCLQWQRTRGGGYPAFRMPSAECRDLLDQHMDRVRRWVERTPGRGVPTLLLQFERYYKSGGRDGATAPPPKPRQEK